MYNTEEWWHSKRLLYNIGLVVSGLLAFGAYALVVETIGANDPELEITIFTIAFQGFAYLILIGFANFCFLLGPYSERQFQPSNVDLYRKVTFRLGFWFSFLIPFAIPILAAWATLLRSARP